MHLGHLSLQSVQDDKKSKTKAQNAMYKNLVKPNPMRWGEHEIKWIRPITSILCLFDNQVLQKQIVILYFKTKINFLETLPPLRWIPSNL